MIPSDSDLSAQIREGLSQAPSLPPAAPLLARWRERSSIRLAARTGQTLSPESQARLTRLIAEMRQDPDAR